MMIDAIHQLLVFKLDDNRYALPISVIERVVRAVEITPMSQGAGKLLGIINVQGQVVPVVNLRRWLHLPERDYGLNDRMIIVRAQERTLVMMVDSVVGITAFTPESIVLSDQIGSGLDDVAGIVKMDGEIIPIIDLARLFAIDIESSPNGATLPPGRS